MQISRSLLSPFEENITPGLIQSDEDNILKLMTGKSIREKTEKIYTYYQSLDYSGKREIRVQLVNQPVLSGCMWAAGGGTLGAAVGSVVGFLYANMPGASSGAWTGLQIGGAAGFVTGFIKGGCEFKAEFIASPKYTLWVKEMKEKQLFPIFKKIVQQDPRFDGFLCPISDDFMTVPMRAPDKRLYEQAEIEKWLKVKEKEIELAKEKGASEKEIAAIREGISPVRGKPFTIKDLTYDKEYFDRLAHLVNEKLAEIEDTETKRLFQIGTEMLREAHADTKKSLFLAIVSEVQVLVIKRKIPQKVVTAACEKLMSQLNVNPYV